MKKNPGMMKLRKSLVEHPFGYFKQVAGLRQLTGKNLKGAQAEMSLEVLAYNFKKILNLVGSQSLIEAII